MVALEFKGSPAVDDDYDEDKKTAVALEVKKNKKIRDEEEKDEEDHATDGHEEVRARCADHGRMELGGTEYKKETESKEENGRRDSEGRWENTKAKHGGLGTNTEETSPEGQDEQQQGFLGVSNTRRKRVVKMGRRKRKAKNN